MCDGNLAMANSLENEDEPFSPFDYCPECGRCLCDIEFDMQFCESCGWDSEDNE